jgi:hypothetical protein
VYAANKLIVTPSDRAPYLAEEYLNGAINFSDSYELAKKKKK